MALPSPPAPNLLTGSAGLGGGLGDLDPAKSPPSIPMDAGMAPPGPAPIASVNPGMGGLIEKILGTGDDPNKSKIEKIDEYINKASSWSKKLQQDPQLAQLLNQIFGANIGPINSPEDANEAVGAPAGMGAASMFGPNEQAKAPPFGDMNGSGAIGRGLGKILNPEIMGG